jgi:hypothetical protein
MSNNDGIVSSAFGIMIDKDIVIVKATDKSILHSQAQEFNRIFELLKRNGYIRFILDLSICDYISSEGLTCAASCWKWCHDDGNGHMVIIVPQKPENEVRNLFDIIGLSRMVGSALQPKLSNAIRYLREFS